MRSRRVPSAAVPGAGLERLGAAMVQLMSEVGASVGGVYLLPEEEPALKLAVLCGATRQIVAPWERISPDAPHPVPDAVRNERLVWLSGQEEIARCYPRLGLTVPYDFMLAAVPIADGTELVGSLALLWPVSHPEGLSADEREAINDFCRWAGLLAHRDAPDGTRLRCPQEPHVLPPPPPSRRRPTAQEEAQAAAWFAERLPTGCCSLDLDGRVVFANAAAADLLGIEVDELKGARPWEALSWLRDDALFEAYYRAAVIGRRPASFTTVRPPDTALKIHLHPDTSGISVQIMPARAEEPAGRTPRPDPLPHGTAEGAGVGTIYKMTHLAAALTEAARLDDVVGLVADHVVPAFGPKGMVLMTAQEGRLRVVGRTESVSGLADYLDGTPLTSGIPAARTLASSRPQFFASFADLKQAYPQAVHAEGMDARAFLPLIASGNIIGTLVLNYEDAHHFPREERAVLLSLAGLIAQALDRARLYDAKHQLARALQSGLLPHALPDISGLDLAARYRPANRGMDIGGDFYDLFRIDPTTAIAAIGDVQGHHTTAAALMGQVRTAVHAHATIGTPPGDILAGTNRLLIDLDPGLFVSCLIVRLDLTRRRTQLATAGHPPPLLRHPDGRTEPVALPAGLLLGIDPDADYPTTEIPLTPGAVLALYTDGMVEIPGIDIDETTAELARQLAEARDGTMDEVADSLQKNAPTSEQRYDDAALLLIRFG
ncbi:SpoIIE family protein phosphatase [Actinomadura sp. 7K534]|uniref:SpoIIE family protein phosphatase n=1 Tax=Actinomadura sp. 7K534 TaxID=2530366 RepID=UPI0010493641|nr:SpoIIE family protein phosphatase [Actinomadura sp. 7K534]TDB95784.1 PAS domain-containing protein [Actinomadura sp. 7K534]